MKSLTIALTLTAGLLGASVLLGQQSDHTVYKHQNASFVYAELKKAPEKSRAKKNPLEADPSAVAGGQNLYEQHCAECHGDTAQGSRRAPSLLDAQVQNAEPGAIFWVLTNGAVWHGMPVWSKLPAPQRWQLVSYIKSLGVTMKEAERSSKEKP